MLYWRPHPESPLVFFTIAGLWGVGDAVWQTQINGTYHLVNYILFNPVFAAHSLYNLALDVFPLRYVKIICVVWRDISVD